MVKAFLFVGVAAVLAAAEPALRVSGVAGRDGVAKPALALSMADLAGMPRTSERVRGRDGQERLYEGVLLAEILRRAGQPEGEELRGSLLARYVLLSAHDGYRVIYSLPEVDPGFTATRVMVADRVDGKPLPEREGPLRIVAAGDKRQARWIRMLEKIEIVSAPEGMR